MTNDQPEFCLYARKSSESDERQAMSIDSQIKEMKTMAQRDEINIKEVRFESHSAKQSGQRPVFKELIADIMLGEFQGILTWHPDRLSRNAGDLGLLVDMMDSGKLKAIKTYSQLFQNTPNDKFLLMILCSQAKLENDNKSVNVRHGIRAKCEMGFRPGMAPLGYFNCAFNGIKDIIIDPDRGPIVTEAFQKVADEGTSGRKLKTWLVEKGFTNRSGKPISLSQIYLLLKNPFYYGTFEYPIGGEKWYKGSYTPLINKELFDRVQKQLVVPAKSKWGNKAFVFKGLFKCASCGSNLVGEDKFRKRKHGEPRYHIYYHCSRQVNYNCPEDYINEKGLTKALFRYINFTYISHPQILNLTQEIREGVNEYKKVRDDVLLRQDIDPDEKTMDIRDYAKHILNNGDTERKRQLIKLFSEQLYLHDRKVVSSRVKKTTE